MVLVAAEAHPQASWEFDADIAILTHQTTIQPKYQVQRGVARVAIKRGSDGRQAAPSQHTSLRFGFVLHGLHKAQHSFHM